MMRSGVIALTCVALIALAGCAPAPSGAGSVVGSITADAPAASAAVLGPRAFVECAHAWTVSSEPATRLRLGVIEDYRASFVHGPKPAACQRYIVIHDTEGSGSPQAVVASWDAAGDGVAAHFVIGRDGTVVQCVPLDAIAHHAGFGDNGHNERYGVTDESRDDRVGTGPGHSWAGDYGMNSYSIGIELVHRGGAEDYTPEQLDALDGVIALIDAHYGFESEIIDHKAWRSGNSDTSPEFAVYLERYRIDRTHDGTGG